MCKTYYIANVLSTLNASGSSPITLGAGCVFNVTLVANFSFELGHKSGWNLLNQMSVDWTNEFVFVVDQFPTTITEIVKQDWWCKNHHIRKKYERWILFIS